MQRSRKESKGHRGGWSGSRSSPFLGFLPPLPPPRPACCSPAAPQGALCSEVSPHPWVNSQSPRGCVCVPKLYSRGWAVGTDGRWYFVKKGFRVRLSGKCRVKQTQRDFFPAVLLSVFHILTNVHLPHGHAMGRVSQTYLTAERLPNVSGCEAEMGKGRKALWRGGRGLTRPAQMHLRQGQQSFLTPGLDWKPYCCVSVCECVCKCPCTHARRHNSWLSAQRQEQG